GPGPPPSSAEANRAMPRLYLRHSARSLCKVNPLDPYRAEPHLPAIAILPAFRDDVGAQDQALQDTARDIELGLQGLAAMVPFRQLDPGQLATRLAAGELPVERSRGAKAGDLRLHGQTIAPFGQHQRLGEGNIL